MIATLHKGASMHSHNVTRVGLLTLCLIATFAFNLGAGDDGAQRKAEAEFIAAARHGNTQKVSDGIAAGINVDAVDDDGVPALLWAAVEGHTKTVEALVEAGADVDAGDSGGVTPLMMASRWALMDTVKVLVGGGADVNIISSVGPGRTALMYASIGGYRGLVKYLLEAGADPSIEDGSGHNASELAQKWGQTAVAEDLKKAESPSPSADSAPGS